MFLNFNGEVRREDEALLRADNRGFRYGDGLFETMLVRGGRLRLGQYHLERLRAGMKALNLEWSGTDGDGGGLRLDWLEEMVEGLRARNGLRGDCRVRLTVFRGGSGLYNDLDRAAGFCIQVGALAGQGWRSEGLSLEVYPDGRKVCDVFSGIKSNNYLLSSLAGMYAAQGGVDECVLLNSFGRVAETAAANIWWVLDGRVFTPPLSEGCVAGVMRRFLLETLPGAGFGVEEKAIRPGELARVDEIFLSNAIKGVQWVRMLRGRVYGCGVAEAIYREFIEKL